jgi:iron complex outermembrane receptor protein
MKPGSIRWGRSAPTLLAISFSFPISFTSFTAQPVLAQPALTQSALAQSAQAQSQPSAPCAVSENQPERTVSGVVADAQGARVPGAAIVAVCGTTTRDARTGADGAYVLRLPPGSYELRVERSGFDVSTERVVVPPDRDPVVNVVLTVGQLAEAVMVSANRERVTRSTTATKTDTPLLETPQSITVISAREIRDQASPNLQEVLRYAPGVRHELYGIDNRGDWISLRGSEEVTTLLDGMRLPLTGWWGVIRAEPYAYERVEVLRGPSSIIAGQNDPGGVVNLVSKRPQAEATREIALGLGNYNRREIHIDATGPLSADRSWLYRFVALGKDTDTQIEHADEQRALVAPSLTWRPNARHSVTVFGEYQYDRSKNTNAFLGLEGTLRAAPHGPIPTDVFIGEPDWDRYGGTRWRVGYNADLALNNDWRLRHNLRYDRVEGLMDSMYAAWWGGFLDEHGASDPNGQYLGRLWYIYDDQSRVTSSEVLLEGHRQTGRVKHTLLFGVDSTIHDSSQASAEGEATPLNVYAPVYGSFARPSHDGASLSENKIRRVGLLAQDQMKFFDRLSLRLGLRRDYVRNSVVGGDVQLDWATTGNIGVVYELLPSLAPYVSYSESFNPIAGTNAEGNAFKPKRGEQIEGGVKWDGRSVPVQLTASVFTLKEKNRLVNDPNNVNFSIQLGEARTKGTELEVRSDVASWSLMGSYAYTRARATATAWGGNLDPNQQLEGVPEHTTSVWAVHDFAHFGLPGVRAGGGVRHVGRIGDGTGNVFVPDVTLFDAMASYDAGRWRLALNLNNLTDKTYIATCLARGDCWFGQRRNVSLTAAFRY